MFKIRCSKIGTLMTGTMGLTAKQTEYLNKLIDKEIEGKELTAKQKEDYSDLTFKRDNITLPKTVVSYLELYAKEKVYSRRKEIYTKYMDKGKVMEDNAIDFAAEHFGWGMVSKNEEQFSNDFIQGEPDLLLKDEVIDIKTSWDGFTFPLFDTEVPESDYWWQLQGYMAITGKAKAGLVYVLMDAPEHLIARAARQEAWQLGYDEVEMELYEKVRKQMTYSHLPAEVRIKRFDFERDDNAIKDIAERVNICRDYIDKNLTINKISPEEYGKSHQPAELPQS